MSGSCGHTHFWQVIKIIYIYAYAHYTHGKMFSKQGNIFKLYICTATLAAGLSQAAAGKLKWKK